MTYGSLFAGAGGFDMAFDRSGYKCAFQCEIDKTASEVLARHWPDVPRHNDVREIGKHNLPKCDVLTFGFPCQDLSVAGQRKGLQGGTRSGLFYEAVRIGAELRCGILVLENVPGLLSSDDGRDFARVLRHLGDSGFHGAWRVLDAQHFGLAQRRKRVFGVFARGHSGAARCAEVLALRESVQRDHPASREAGEEVAGTLGDGSGVRGRRNDLGRCGAFVAGTLNANGRAAGSATSQDANSNLLVACTLPASDGGVSSGMHPVVAFSANDYTTGGYRECDISAPLTTGTDSTRGAPVIAFQERGREGGRSLESQENLAYALTAPNGGGRGQERNIATGLGVRRLTPRECERLQGWPEWELNYEVELCFGLPRNLARADNQNRKSRRRVSPAEATASNATASSAARGMNPNDPRSSRPVHGHARLFCGEELTVLADGLGNPLWCVNNVAQPEASASRVSIADFAHRCVGIGLIAERAIPSGREELALNERCSILRSNGRTRVRLFGDAKTLPASGAASGSFTTGDLLTKCITSHHSLSSPSVLNFLTSCSFVASAMTGFIPTPMWGGNSLLVDVTLRYCHTRYRADGSEIADGPRYRLIGNGVAAPCAEWIGRRLMNLERSGT